jgi:hypothetical protein
MDIVQVIRAQMLGQLIDAVGGSAAAKGGAPQTQAAPPDALLTAGRTLTATVLGEAAGGKLALRIGGQAFVADTGGASPLPAEARLPGATLRLSVEAGGALPRLALASFSPPPEGLSRPPAGPIADAPLVRLTAMPAAQQTQTAPTSPPGPLQAALKEAVAAAAARQGGAAPLYANLAAVADRTDSPLPLAARGIASLLLGGRIDGERPVTAEAVRQAVAMAAGGAMATPDAPPDVKTLLAVLKAVLPREAEQPPAARSEPPPEPPRRDSPPHAQRPAATLLHAETDARTIAATLHRDADQALERAKLHAYAGLPDARPAGQAEAQRPQQMQIELPVAFGQQTAMMGLKVERDPRRRRENGDPVDVWGIRFAIETDEIGAVHAHLRLAGRTLNVSLWADDAATQGAFVDALPLLEAALRDAALEVDEIAVFGGRPQEATKPAAGHFLDVSS